MSMTDDREGQIDSTRLIFPGLAGLSAPFASVGTTPQYVRYRG
jgi:hypothetical protein